jgi:PAS domain S-box-containing protein
VGPFLFVYVALVGFFGAAALIHAILWWSSRRQALLAVFSVDCGLRAAVSLALAEAATVTTPAEAHGALRARVAFGMLAMVTQLWSLSLASGVRARKLMVSATAVFASLFVVHSFFAPLNMDVVSVEPRLAPWGETIPVIETERPGWRQLPLYGLALGVQAFGLYCGSRLWIRDRTAGWLVMAGTLGLALVLVLDVLRSVGLVPGPIFGAIPQVLWVVAIALLIADGNRQTRQRLAASEQRFRGVFDQTFQLVVLLSTEGTLIDANRTALEFAGVRKQDVAGKPFWETPWWVHSPELQSRLREAIPVAAAGDTVRFEVTHPRSDGSLMQVDFSLKPIRDDHGRVVLLISEGRDVTERNLAEEKKRVLESQLAQRRGMESIGQLATGVAHDFNNLLTVIAGNSELLRSMTTPDDARSGMVAGIRHASERAAALTRQLLTFSRRQVVEPHVVDLNALVLETEELLRRLIREDIRLVTDLHPGELLVKEDPILMCLVIL